MEFGIPLGEGAEAVAQRGGRTEGEVALEGSGIGVGCGDIAWLHGDELFVGFEVVIAGEHSCTDKFFLQGLHKVEKVLGVGVADVVDNVWGHGQAVVAKPTLWCVAHDAIDAFDNVVDIGEVALTVAVVENLNVVAS